ARGRPARSLAQPGYHFCGEPFHLFVVVHERVEQDQLCPRARHLLKARDARARWTGDRDAGHAATVVSGEGALDAIVSPRRIVVDVDVDALGDPESRRVAPLA